MSFLARGLGSAFGFGTFRAAETLGLGFALGFEVSILRSFNERPCLVASELIISYCGIEDGLD